ncbi:hypothetical protein MASR1M65_18640 [Saprospiraceae bacterium]|nr:hypothetical protein [Saprospiraceae bacterium]
MFKNKFSIGDILEGTNRKFNEAYHYVVFYAGNTDDDFCGGFITTSPKYQNIPMKSEHFESGHKIGYTNSYLAAHKFIKLKDWGPYKKVGRLSKEGIEFLEQNIGHLEPELYTDYALRLLNNR